MAEYTSEFHFRNALHGFNREDVVAYIEQSTREYEDEIQRLRGANQKLNAQLREMTDELDQAREYKDAAEKLEAANRELEALQSEHRALQDRVMQLEEDLEQSSTPAVETEDAPLILQQDITAPILPISEVVPPELSPSKDYSELELAAYRRAEMAERLARERAQSVYRQIQSVFGNANLKLSGGKADLEQITQAIQADVEQLLHVLVSIRGAYQEAETSFAAVNEDCNTDSTAE